MTNQELNSLPLPKFDYDFSETSQREVNNSMTTEAVDDSDVYAGRAPIPGDPAIMGRIIHEELERRKQV
jgi:hypothetical protein